MDWEAGLWPRICGRPRRRRAVAEDLELRYYLDFPRVLTLTEFAEKLQEMRPH